MRALHGVDTPEERLGEITLWLVEELTIEGKKLDRHEFQRRYRVYVRRELILSRIAEARKLSSTTLSLRMEELGAELMEINRYLPAEHRL